jgi:hypothetical protein
MRLHLQSHACTGSMIIRGFVLLSLGTVFLLVNLGFLESDLVRTWWPLLVIALGAIKLFFAATAHEPRKPYNDFGPV